MNDDQQRVYVDALYPSTHWKQKVSRMPEAQIYAIYKKFQKELQIQENREKQEPDDKQGTLF